MAAIVKIPDFLRDFTRELSLERLFFKTAVQMKTKNQRLKASGFQALIFYYERSGVTKQNLPQPCRSKRSERLRGSGRLPANFIFHSAWFLLASIIPALLPQPPFHKPPAVRAIFSAFRGHPPPASSNSCRPFRRCYPSTLYLRRS